MQYATTTQLSKGTQRANRASCIALCPQLICTILDLHISLTLVCMYLRDPSTQSRANKANEQVFPIPGSAENTLKYHLKQLNEFYNEHQPNKTACKTHCIFLWHYDAS